MPRVTGFYVRNSAGFAQLLKSPGMATAVHGFAEDIANNVNAELLTNPYASSHRVIIDDYASGGFDRVASSVTIAGPLGKYLEVRYGLLSRAAAANGTKVVVGGKRAGQ